MVDPPFFAPQNFRPPSPPQPSRIARRAALARGGHRALPPDAAAAGRATSTSSTPSPAARRARRSTSMGSPAGRSASTRISGRNSAGSTRSRSSPPRAAPLALIRGAKSKLFKADDADYLMSFLAARLAPCRHPRGRASRDDRPAAGVRAALRALLPAWPTSVCRKRVVRRQERGPVAADARRSPTSLQPSAVDRDPTQPPFARVDRTASTRRGEARAPSASRRRCGGAPPRPTGAPLTNQANGGAPPSAFSASRGVARAICDAEVDPRAVGRKGDLQRRRLGRGHGLRRVLAQVAQRRRQVGGDRSP